MREQEQGWFRLLMDSLSEGQPEPRLLVRYLLRPEALSQDERGRLEDRIACDRQVADQIEVLRRLLFRPGTWVGPRPPGVARESDAALESDRSTGW